jgi:tetratricopeptide (TPR) repeat protein
MKITRLVIASSLSAGLWSLCVAQSPKPETSADDAVVSVHDLPLPHKAARAFEKGTQLLLKGDAQGSLTYFLKAVEQAPAAYRPYHNLALAYYNVGQLEAAEQNFQKAIDLTSGTFAPSMFGLAVILYRQSELARAEKLIREGLLLQPGSAPGKYCLGLVQFSMGRANDAEQSAREALALDPRETDAYVLLARIHEAKHDFTAELTDAQNYLKDSPSGVLRSAAGELMRHAQRELETRSAELN